MKYFSLLIFFIVGCSTINQYPAEEAKRMYQESGCCAEVINEDAICYHCQGKVNQEIFLYWDNSWEN